MILKKILLISTIMAMAACSTQVAPPAIPKDSQIEQQVDEVLSNMTLDEKIGQMTELAIDVLGDFEDGEFKLDDSKLNKAIAEFKVGSFLNAPGPVAQNREKWQEIIGKIQAISMKEIGIPCIYGLDQTHGTTYTLDGTLFPQNINIAASFNPELAYEAARVTAYETRAANCPWTYSPTVDMARDPRWSRVWENFGEDCLVNSIMGSSAVRGYQGDDPNHIPADRVATSVKHYMGYSMSRTGKDRTPAYISVSDLREKCFAPFKECVEAGALTIMVNSGSINGVPVHADYELLTKWLKEDLNWDGMLITDWADINNLYTREHIAADKKEAIQIAINAGIDMAMEPYDLSFCTLLKELVQEDKVQMSRIDDAVRRILRLKFRLNLFECPNTLSEDYPLFGSSEHAELALRSAEESQILLKNKDNILPLVKGKKFLVTGPNANSMRCLNGGWSYSWQGHLADRFAGKYNTIYEALSNKFGVDNVRLEQGVTYKPEGGYTEENEPEIEKAVAAARNVDIIIACIGENSYCETPGNLSDLVISANQSNLVKALATTRKPIILILNEGRPRIINDLEPLASGIINILLPGNYGGDALANILAGDVNPSAKMPYTYPRNQAELTTYDYRVSEEMDKMEGAYDYDAVISVQWPFGYGLSYTTFEYSNFQTNVTSFTAENELHFSIDVTNSGARAGKEVVMLFSRDLVASLTPESRRLRAFKKVELQPGETKTVTMLIKGSDLAFVGADGKWILEQGDFRMQIGNQTVNITCNKTYKWNTPNK
ncbi:MULTISPECIES: glycoside hydrolase family 3 N-terminal domain-containing protein [unclassified Dysgonomonas]|uniref:glycoside hydrolase family 3 N-terminal domain-containing protein n=1 Tax=unclassified Dysgonomonas TaxID=2630389 RepID=UPI0025BFCFDE|nr:MULTISPECIES: glycoside hydrolase family 3 N-terminal domain-containing protein [unclassified Dysgonomonas]MDR2002942.1 glycoside hydrolase family 3 C-terminal domain-containing protein [Prevotella sp.]HMM03940.1 glycoside hydrolase family 3 N-terminal domain-containing protein [Dysgonomonas sp.]